MTRSYTADQREQVRKLLEQGRDEDTIEKESGVSDRTIRRWKLELERTGRIGKPPESRTGRHRVLSKEVEEALFEHVKDKPEMTVDDMLWWLYDTYKIVVGTRTIRRVFERKGDKIKTGSGKDKAASRESAEGQGQEELSMMGQEELRRQEMVPPLPPAQNTTPYQSPYAPITTPAPASIDVEAQLRQAMQQHTPQQHPYPALLDLEADLPDDEESIQLELQRIALQKREVELKLKMRRLKGDITPTTTPRPNGTSTLYNPHAVIPPPSKRDSRSKKKIQESKARTAERQERMLRDLERRSRRRDHLTAEWVQSKDIWPLRAQGILADLMHQYSTYAYSTSSEGAFAAMYRELYGLVDHAKGDWVPDVHDEMLRERMKRKMAQLRTKMQKTGEILARNDGYAGFVKAPNYTGEQAGAATLGADDNDALLVQDPALHHQPHPPHSSSTSSDPMQTQPGAPNMQQQPQPHPHPDDGAPHMHYDVSVAPDGQLHHPQAAMEYPAPMMPGAQYEMLGQGGHLMPYAQMGVQGEGMVL